MLEAALFVQYILFAHSKIWLHPNYILLHLMCEGAAALFTKNSNFVAANLKVKSDSLLLKVVIADPHLLLCAVAANRPSPL